MDLLLPHQCLPTPAQTFLLRAALLRGESAGEAWQNWNEQMGDLKVALKGENRLWIKRLLPLLLLSVKRNRLPVDGELLMFLKMAYAAERLRDEFCHKVGREILEALIQSKLQPVVIRGFAFAETVYEESTLRHCHDIDLFMRPVETLHAANALLGLNCLRQIPTAAHYLRFAHPSGLEIVIHEHLFPEGIDLDSGELLNRRLNRVIAGTTSSVFAPADALVHTCAAAWSAGLRPSPVWICDVRFLLARFHDSDWAQTRDLARRGGLEKPVHRTLRYIEQELETPVVHSISPESPRD